MIVKSFKILAMALWGLLMLSGCASMGGEETANKVETAVKASYRIVGSVTYRERVALPQKSVVTISLEDISLADRPSVRIAERSITPGRHQVPIKFVLEVDPARLEDNHRYAVRADIRDVRGNLLWTTDSINLIDPQQDGMELGSLVLVRVTGG